MTRRVRILVRRMGEGPGPVRSTGESPVRRNESI